MLISVFLRLNRFESSIYNIIAFSSGKAIWIRREICIMKSSTIHKWKQSKKLQKIMPVGFDIVDVEHLAFIHITFKNFFFKG